MSSEARPFQLVIVSLTGNLKDEATVKLVSDLMDRTTQDLKNPSTPDPQPTHDPTSPSSRRCYCPREDELNTARQLLRPNVNSKQGA